MPRGQPDYGVYQQKIVGATLADLGEAVVRLGSINSYDKRGDTVFQDDFESPVLKWEIIALLGTAVILDAQTVRSGSQAVKFSTPAAYPRFCSIEKHVYFLGTRRLGGELHFSRPPTAASLILDMFYYDGVNAHEGRCVVDFPNGTLEIQDGAGIQQTIAGGLTFPIVNFGFIPLKLVVDFSTNRYVRLLLGNVEYDISNYTLRAPLSAVTLRDFIRIMLVNDATATASDIWVDDVIYTQNEP